MNYTEIKEKYPKAYNLYREYYFKNANTIATINKIFDEVYVEQEIENTSRRLYDFFDINEIYISTFPFITDFGILFSPHVSTKKSKNNAGKLSTKYSRKEAEEEAFLKAFCILENELI